MSLDPRLETIIARWRSTTFAGEKQAARHLGEVLAQRSGMTFDNVVSMFGGARPFMARPSPRRSRASVPTLRVESIRDLARIRHWLAAWFLDDERMAGRVVTMLRNRSTVETIVRVDAALAWDAERIAAGRRFRRENLAADSECRQAA